MQSDSTHNINRIQELKEKLKHWSYLYYEKGEPVVSDQVYDAHYQELLELEQQENSTIDNNSPSQIVGHEVSDNRFQKVTHKYKMLSLENAFNFQDLKDWLTRIEKTQGQDTDNIQEIPVYAELKIDGVSISLIYNQGKLIQAITRGNGEIGEDVTHNIMTIRDIPKEIKYQDYLEVRGEVYMSQESFDQVNKQRQEDQQELFANPRNATAGTIRLLDSNIAQERNLSCWTYTSPNYNTQTHSELLEFLQQNNFPINPANKLCLSRKELSMYIQYWDTNRDNLNYPTDGIVFKVNNIQLQESLGHTAKYPKWAVAYKFTAETAETQVENIEFEVGRTGAITPVANLLPVLLAGTTVKRATLHNRDNINRLGINVGDTVKIHKAGEIIPEVLEVITKGENKEAQEFVTHCPSCGTELIQPENEVAIYCPNKQTCPAQVQGMFEHWANALEINGLGDKIINKLISQELIQDVSDLYNLTEEDFLGLEGFKEKSANNLYTAIQDSKSNYLENIIFGLGIKHIGLTTAKTLATEFNSLQELLDIAQKDSVIEELESIENIGKLIAQEIKEYFTESKNIELINKLQQVLTPKVREKIRQDELKLSSQKFVITGTHELGRKELKELIVNNGGKVISAISPQIDYLLAGEKAGSKLTKAQELNIRVINQQELLELIN